MSEAPLPSQFVQALRDLRDWFQAEGVPHTLIGGVAVSLIAEPRATRDIDACVWLDLANVEALLAAGRRFGYATRLPEALEFARRSRVLLLVHQPGAISVDVSIGTLPFEREMISGARTITFGDTQLTVPRPEDLIIMKAVAHRPRDLTDIESILRCNTQLDLNRIRHWVREFATALEMPEISQDLERILGQV